MNSEAEQWRCTVCSACFLNNHAHEFSFRFRVNPHLLLHSFRFGAGNEISVIVSLWVERKKAGSQFRKKRDWVVGCSSSISCFTLSSFPNNISFPKGIQQATHTLSTVERDKLDVLERNFYPTVWPLIRHITHAFFSAEFSAPELIFMPEGKT